MLKILKKVRFCRFYWFLCKNAVPSLSPRKHFCPSKKLCNKLCIKYLQSYKWVLKKTLHRKVKLHTNDKMIYHRLSQSAHFERFFFVFGDKAIYYCSERAMMSSSVPMGNPSMRRSSGSFFRSSSRK